jgi:hypothetical protein
MNSNPWRGVRDELLKEVQAVAFEQHNGAKDDNGYTFLWWSVDCGVNHGLEVWMGQEPVG